MNKSFLNVVMLTGSLIQACPMGDDGASQPVVTQPQPQDVRAGCLDVSAEYLAKCAQAQEKSKNAPVPQTSTVQAPQKQ